MTGHPDAAYLRRTASAILRYGLRSGLLCAKECVTPEGVEWVRGKLEQVWQRGAEQMADEMIRELIDGRAALEDEPGRGAGGRGRADEAS